MSETRQVCPKCKEEIFRIADTIFVKHCGCETLPDRYTELMAHANALAKALEWRDELCVPLHFHLPDNVQQALFDFQAFKSRETK
jgi:hypothetical protein